MLLSNNFLYFGRHRLEERINLQFNILDINRVFFDMEKDTMVTWKEK